MTTYRVLITGSRDWIDARRICAELERLHAEHGAGLVIVHGACPRGADRIAAGWARRHNVKQEVHPADWHGQGRAAGFRRNARMVASGPDLCLAFIRAGSRGATHCARLAEAAGIETRRWFA